MLKKICTTLATAALGIGLTVGTATPAAAADYVKVTHSTNSDRAGLYTKVMDDPYYFVTLSRGQSYAGYVSYTWPSDYYIVSGCIAHISEFSLSGTILRKYDVSSGWWSLTYNRSTVVNVAC